MSDQARIAERSYNLATWILLALVGIVSSFVLA
jgi:hypothetical protein